LLAIVGANTVTFHVLAWKDSIAAGCPIAFSSLVLGGLLLILIGTWAQCAPARGHSRSEAMLIWAMVSVCLIGFPLTQMFCFGMTDYRRPADVVVVFGARVYADGRPSQALADRVRTGCSLYREGLVHKVILSGGPGDGDVHETEGMRRMALRLGVRAEDILVDEQGLNTQATVENTCETFNTHRLPRVIAVSHFYHLPRVKMAYQRHGREVYTVPAHETYRLTALPIYMMREIAALWVYYARPLWT
jgi:vancomycin permeability regulator SanA